jgi:tRNA U34 5-methylaminomethyl-2-thiouridine-forming methyltransferase MnmC
MTDQTADQTAAPTAVRTAAPPAEIDWWGTTPASRRWGDPYFAREGGLAEARHVFLAGCGLPERLRPGFRLLELGFGTGLNCLATLAAWRAAGAGGTILYTGFEAHPLAPEDRARALRAFPELAAEAAALTAALAAGPGPWDLGGLRLSLVEGDARATLPAWDGVADAAYLDGFAPAKNPEMWEPPLIAAVAARLAPGARLATYSAAGAVRRALAAAGLAVERRPGFGRKRHMTVAWRP